MTCFYLTNEKTAEVSAEIEKKIFTVIERYRLRIGRQYGLSSHNDGGIDDVSYSHEYSELTPENFIVDDNRIIGYSHDGHAVAFHGTETGWTLIYEIDETDHSGWNDLVDITTYNITPKE